MHRRHNRLSTPISQTTSPQFQSPLQSEARSPSPSPSPRKKLAFHPSPSSSTSWLVDKPPFWSSSSPPPPPPPFKAVPDSSVAVQQSHHATTSSSSSSSLMMIPMKMKVMPKNGIVARKQQRQQRQQQQPQQRQSLKVPSAVESDQLRQKLEGQENNLLHRDQRQHHHQHQQKEPGRRMVLVKQKSQPVFSSSPHHHHHHRNPISLDDPKSVGVSAASASSSTAPTPILTSSTKRPGLLKQRSQPQFTRMNGTPRMKWKDKNKDFLPVPTMTPIRSVTKDRRLNQYIAKTTGGKLKKSMSRTSKTSSAATKTKGRLYVDTTFSSLITSDLQSTTSSPLALPSSTIPHVIAVPGPNNATNQQEQQLASPTITASSNKTCRSSSRRPHPATIATSAPSGDRFIPNRALSSRRVLFDIGASSKKKEAGINQDCLEDDGGDSYDDVVDEEHDPSHLVQNDYHRHLLDSICNHDDNDASTGGDAATGGASSDGGAFIFGSSIPNHRHRNNGNNNNRSVDVVQHNTLRSIPTLGGPYSIRIGSENIDSFINRGRGSSTIGCRSSFSSAMSYRPVPKLPTKTLDAPDLLNDFYLQCLDWSSNDIVAIALDKTLYLWDAATGTTDMLGSFCDSSFDHNEPHVGEVITSIAWNEALSADILAVGYNTCISVFDTTRRDPLRSLKVLRGHPSHGRQNYITAIEWNGASCVTSSTKHDTRILYQDIRKRHPTVMVFQGHRAGSGGVCGLKWDRTGKVLAAGGNDDTICIFDIAMSGRQRTSSQSSTEAFLTSRVEPRIRLEGHKGAVKGLDWCPSSRHILASGGGSLDRSLKLWNTTRGECCSTLETGAQVTGVKWSTCGRSLCTSHGWESRCPLVLWGHTSSPHSLKYVQSIGCSSTTTSSSIRQAFYLAAGPDGRNVAVAGDGNLCFFDVFRPSGSKRRLDSSLAPMEKLTFGMNPIR